MHTLQTGEVGIVGGTTTPVLAVLDHPYIDPEAQVYTA